MIDNVDLISLYKFIRAVDSEQMGMGTISLCFILDFLKHRNSVACLLEQG